MPVAACRRGLGHGARAGYLTAVLAGVIVGVAAPARGAPTLTVGSAQLGNLFLTTEPPVLTLSTTAGDAPFRGRLRIGARDAYGRSAGSATVRLDVSSGDTVTSQFTMRSDRRGFFRIKARLVSAHGGTVAAVATTAGVVPPLDAGPAEDSAVGYYVLPLDGERPRAMEIAAHMRRLGIRWVRMTFDWWHDGRRARPDVTDPAWLDSAAFEHWTDAFRAHGIEVVGTLFGTARWASSMPAAAERRLGIPTWALAAPGDLRDWELMVRTLGERLRGRVRTWEVWNEPDLDLFWVSTAAEFVALVRTTHDVLRAVDPDAGLMVSLVDFDTPSGVTFYETLLSEVGGLLDVFGFHYGFSDEWLEATRAARSRLRPGGSVWNTEAFGAPRRHVSWWLWHRTHGVERIFPFIFHTNLDDREWIPAFTQFGVHPVNLDYTPRPAAIAQRTLADLVGSATPLGFEEIGLGYRAHAFTGPGGPVVALLDPNDGQTTWSSLAYTRLRLAVPRDVRRVTVVDVMGNRRVARVRRGRLRLRLQGVVAFLLPEPGQSLAGLSVVRARGAVRR